MARRGKVSGFVLDKALSSLLSDEGDLQAPRRQGPVGGGTAKKPAASKPAADSFYADMEKALDDFDFDSNDQSALSSAPTSPGAHWTQPDAEDLDAELFASIGVTPTAKKAAAPTSSGAKPTPSGTNGGRGAARGKDSSESAPARNHVSFQTSANPNLGRNDGPDSEGLELDDSWDLSDGADANGRSASSRNSAKQPVPDPPRDMLKSQAETKKAGIQHRAQLDEDDDDDWGADTGPVEIPRPRESSSGIGIQQPQPRSAGNDVPPISPTWAAESTAATRADSTLGARTARAPPAADVPSEAQRNDPAHPPAPTPPLASQSRGASALDFFDSFGSSKPTSALPASSNPVPTSPLLSTRNRPVAPKSPGAGPGTPSATATTAFPFTFERDSTGVQPNQRTLGPSAQLLPNPHLAGQNKLDSVAAHSPQFQAQNQALTAQVAELQRQLAAAETERLRYQTELQHTQTERTALSAETERLRAEVIDLQSQLTAANTARENAQAALQNSQQLAQTDAESRDHLVSSLQARVQAFDSQLQSKLEELSDTHRAQQARVNSEWEQRLELQAARSQQMLDDTKAHYEAMLREVRTAHATTTQQLRNDHQHELEQLHAAHQIELRAFQNAKDQAGIIAELTQSLQASSQELASLQAEASSSHHEDLKYKLAQLTTREELRQDLLRQKAEQELTALEQRRLQENRIREQQEWQQKTLMQQETMQQERQLLAEMQAAERASIDELRREMAADRHKQLQEINEMRRELYLEKAQLKQEKRDLLLRERLKTDKAKRLARDLFFRTFETLPKAYSACSIPPSIAIVPSWTQLDKYKEHLKRKRRAMEQEQRALLQVARETESKAKEVQALYRKVQEAQHQAAEQQEDARLALQQAAQQRALLVEREQRLKEAQSELLGLRRDAMRSHGAAEVATPPPTESDRDGPFG
ncbi:uncharacterized protein MONBRDRAFT_23117 [Monosiga brevicollis MX1]|uniref:Uncharacterized protein n=1 Tax=Monosiga brevicollis TaxID=81824 RepID=A9UR85_MONBE|nr:uncharacterized protein MONBRDRAFT_23117 [Monosiga brevicollis MX1]EDQ92199.1 predicted protein [Monosiga brevicollis MX1]|eukprot:XP_001743485.1 hypothetical protein [Monosiga brevicollis MX1]